MKKLKDTRFLKVIVNGWRVINKKAFMPILELTLFSVIVWTLFSLFHLNKEWRIGLVFLILNSVVAYQIGRIVKKRQLRQWWLLVFPVVFSIAVVLHYAKYNYLLSLMYLAISFLGLWQNEFYREKRVK